MREAEHAGLVFLLDGDVALDGEIDERGGDVAHGGLVIDESAALAGRELVGRLVLHGDDVALRVAAARPPEPVHYEENDHGNEEGPVALEEQRDVLRRGGFVNEALVEADDGRESLAVAERTIRANLDDVVADRDLRVLRARIVGAGIRDGVKSSGTFGQLNPRAGGLDWGLATLRR